MRKISLSWEFGAAPMTRRRVSANLPRPATLPCPYPRFLELQYKTNNDKAIAIYFFTPPGPPRGNSAEPRRRHSCGGCCAGPVADRCCPDPGWILGDHRQFDL